MKEYPTQEELKELFTYYKDGHLVWKKREGRNNNIGKRAGGKNGIIYIRGSRYSERKILSIISDGESISSMGEFRKPVKGDYIGVHTIESGSFVSQFQLNGKNVYLGTYKTEEAAAWAYNMKALEEGVVDKWNDVEELNPDDFKVDLKAGNAKKKTRAKSGFKGVYPNKKRWMVKFKKENLGTYDTKEEAARVYNKRAFSEYGESAFLNDIPDPLGSGF